ncbi:MAG: ATP phosphoribosyltransferase, partial [Cytophagales bacterium]|nr:ATP phosphoribosyltransferase [Cytophagales bacterium]
MSEIIRIAIQKSGRLSEDSLGLVRECGIQFNNGTGKLKSEAANFPAEFLSLRDDDIPGYVADGVADVGIVGENVLIETNQPVQLVHRLGFSRCRLSLAVPRGDDYRQLSDLNGKRIATSYPRILGNFLRENNVQADIHEISGSVEIAPSIGLTEAICD